MSQAGRVHLLTRVHGRKEVHLLGNADLAPSFKILKQLLGDLWDIDDVSNCVLEYTGTLLESPTEAVIIGSEGEWAFARERLCKASDSRAASSTALTVKNRSNSSRSSCYYDSFTGYCEQCDRMGNRSRSSCLGCGAKARASQEPETIEPIPMLIRARPSKLTLSELEILSDTERASRNDALTQERDALRLSSEHMGKELKAQKDALEVLKVELDKLKTTNKAQYDTISARTAAYQRETGKPVDPNGRNISPLSWRARDSAAAASSTTLVSGFDIGYDDEASFEA